MSISYNISLDTFWIIEVLKEIVGIIQAGKVSCMAHNISFETKENEIEVYLHNKENNPSDCDLWGTVKNAEDANRMLEIVWGWQDEN